MSAEPRGSYRFQFEEEERYTLLQCPVCDLPILVAETFYYGQMGWEPDAPRILYPQASKQLGDAVPKSVSASYFEAGVCIANGAYVAAAIMCRRALEAVAKSLLKEPNRELAANLAALRSTNLIDPQLLEWAEALRVAGNDAAHSVEDEVSKQDAQDLLEFTHALAEYAFTYKARFAEFRKRTDARKVTKGASQTAN